MSKFNCQVGEAIEFPRQQARKVFKDFKKKCCGFVGATVVADAAFVGPSGATPELAQGEVVPLQANTLIGFGKVSDETFTALSCGTYSVTLKVRVATPGVGNTAGPFMFRIEIVGCGPARTLDVLNIPETTDRTFAINRTVCLRKGEGIRVVAVTEIDLGGNETVFLVLSASKISDCCDGDAGLGFCRDCPSCDKCDFDDHRFDFDHHHSDFGGHHDCKRC